MAPPGGSGTSSASTRLTNSGSEGNPGHAVDQRKQRRMLSNRESAKRSRLRKRKLLDDLTAEALLLRRENDRITADLRVVAQRRVVVEAENAVLLAQVTELSTRLQSLKEILRYLEGNNGGFVWEAPPEAINGFFVDPWSLGSANQAIMASPAAFQY